MEYNIFRENLLEKLKEMFSDKVIITYEQIPKNNGIVLDGIVLSKEKECAAPVIYVEEYYELYEKGVPMESLLEKIQWNFQNCKSQIHITREFFKTYEPLKKRIFYKLINYDMNRERLKKIPYKRFLDLAMVFYYQVEGENSTATITIQNNHLQMWGITLEELVDNAIKYTVMEQPAEFLTMAQLAGMVDDEQEEFRESREFPMYILTNKQRRFGAGTILYPGIMEKAEKILGEQFFILPSSIHECILIPANGTYEKEELAEMVTSINSEHVEPGEVLADRAYYYCSEDKKISM